MTDSPDTAPAPRPGMMPENVAVLVIAALLVGLLVGQALGRRQGLTIRQVALPANMGDPHAGMDPHAHEMGEDDAALAASAPKAPESIAEAVAMVEQMGHADVDTLISLADRKLGNKVNYLALGFYLKAVELAPDRADAWFGLRQGYRAVGETAKAQEAYAKYLELAPAGDRAAEAKAALTELGG